KVTADDLSKVEGQPNPTLSAAITGFINGGIATITQGGGAPAMSQYTPSGVFVIANNLYLIGGSGNDTVNITAIGSSNDGSTGIHVHSKLDGINAVNDFHQQFTAIRFIGLGGNDNIQIGNQITIKTYVLE